MSQMETVKQQLAALEEQLQAELEAAPMDYTESRLALFRLSSCTAEELKENTELIEQAQQTMKIYDRIQPQLQALRVVSSWIDKIPDLSQFGQMAQQVGDLLGGVAGGVTEDAVKPIIDIVNLIVPALAQPVGDGLKGLEPILVQLINFVLNESVAIADATAEARENVYKSRARSRRSAFLAYTGAGFTKAEALALLLSDHSNASAVIGGVASAAAKTRSSSR